MSNRIGQSGGFVRQFRSSSVAAKTRVGRFRSDPDVAYATNDPLFS